jgi:hypothetical protein
MGALISKPKIDNQYIVIFEITQDDIFRIRAYITVTLSINVEILDV